MGKIESEILSKLEPKDRKALFYVGLLMAILLLIFSGVDLYKQVKCREKGGLLLENKECYLPMSQEERQLILEKGYYDRGERNNYSYNWSILIPKYSNQTNNK